jgi:hypothetical protein
MTSLRNHILTPEKQNTRTFRHVLSVVVRDPLSLASTIIIILFILIAIFARQIAPYPLEEPEKQTQPTACLPLPQSIHLAQTSSDGMC